MMRRSFLALAFVAAVSACVGPPPPPPPRPRPQPAPPPPQVTAPAKVLGEDWRDWPYTPGDWVYRQDARGSIALYGPRGADAELTLRCDRAARTMYLSRKGVAAANDTVRTSTLVRSVQMVPTGGTPPYVAVAIAPSDPLLDAMGFSRGRFVIEQAGQPPLVVPAWAEVERVTEDCRG
jgi:hypothetical protein